MTGGALEGRRILMIEDEAIVAMMLEDMLEEIGCNVTDSAASLDKALRLAETTDAEAAILDINLNGAEVYPAAERLAARRIPVIFATGYGRKSIPPRWQRTPILGKPVAAAELELALHSVFDACGPARQAAPERFATRFTPPPPRTFAS